MKGLLIAMMLVCFAVCNIDDVQETIAELPIEFQVPPKTDNLRYIYNWLKDIFEEPNRSCPREASLFKQCDSRWANDKISTQTLCQVGCLVSSVSMALECRGKSVGTAINPGTLNHWLRNNGGYSGNLFMWGSVNKLGVSYVGKVYSTSEMSSYIDKGYDVILNVRNGGHWVLATGHDANNFFVRDPGYSVSSYAKSGVREAGVYRG